MDFTTSYNGSSKKSDQKPYYQKTGLVYTGSNNYKVKTETVNVVPQAITTAQVFVSGPDQGRNDYVAQLPAFQAPMLANDNAFNSQNQLIQSSFSAETKRNASHQDVGQQPSYQVPPPGNQEQVAPHPGPQAPVSRDDKERNSDKSHGYSSAVSEPRTFLDMDSGKTVQESNGPAARIAAANNTSVLTGKPAFNPNKSNPYKDYQSNYQPMQPAKYQKVDVSVSNVMKNSAMATAPNVFGNQPNYHQVQSAKQQQFQGYHQQNSYQAVASVALGDPAVQHASADNGGQYGNGRPDNQNIPPRSGIPGGNAQFDYQNGMKPTVSYPSLPGQFGQGNNLMQPNLAYPAYNHGGQPQMPPHHGHANTGGRYNGHYGSQQPNNYHHYHQNQQNAQQQHVGHGHGHQQNQYGRDPASSFRYASNYAREAYAQGQRRREEAAQERRRAAAANRAAQRERDAEKEQASPNKKRKQRITLTDQQRNFLESFYNQCKYPLSDQTESLSYNTGLTFKELKTWFKNRRSKDRREGRLIRR